MLYLVTGNVNDRRSYINELISSKGGNPSSVVRISADDLSLEQDLSSLVVTQSGLFGETEFFVLNDLARVVPLKSILPEYAESANIIIFSEASITKAIQSDFDKVNAEVKTFGEEVTEKKQESNIFSLADSLGMRDKKHLWLKYQELRSNATPEEMIGILVWQVKNMLMVYEHPTGPKGMKPFVLKKNQGYIKRYTERELKDMMVELVTLFHNRVTHYPLEIQLERFILSV